MTVSSAERDGARLHVERAGSGPPLLYISGTGGDLRVRPNVFDGPLAEHFDLVSYDQRGLGQSDQPPGPYSMAGYGDDAAAVLDAVGLDRAALIGVSFGGMVAQELLLRHPGRVTRAVLCCTSSGGAGGPSYPLHELALLPATERADRMIEITDRRWSDPAFADPRREETRRRYAQAAPPTPGALLQLEARRHHDTYERLGSISCPVLVCAGRYDGIAPLPNAEALVAAIPGARLAIFEGGHAFLNQDPNALPAIIDFLQGGGPA